MLNPRLVDKSAKKKASGVATASPTIASAAKKKRAGDKRERSLPEWCSNHELLCFSVVAAIWILALYWNVLKAPFVYDDLDQIVNNPSLRSWHAAFARFFLSPVSFTTEFLGGGGSTYRPLYWLTLMLDRQVWGVGGASGFHFTNLLLQWANGVVLFSVLRRLSIPFATAAAASILWLGLPINSEAVAWVSGRAYLLSTLFILSGLLFAYLYLSDRKPVILACYFISSFAAVFSHEQGSLLLPFTVLLIYWMRRSDRAVWFNLAGVALATDILYVAAKHWVGARSGQGASALWPLGLVFWKYLKWMVAPVHMSVERSTSLPPNAPSITAIVAWVAMLALVGAAVLLRKKVPVPATGIVCGCIALLPFCGIVHIYQGMAERFLYLASIGFTLSIVSFAIANRKVWNGVAVGALVLWMTWGAWRLRTRVLDWDDPVSLYRSSLEATPDSSTLFYNLGFSLREQGDLENALLAYQDAIRIQPKYQRAFASIGDIYARLGKPAEAIQAYDRALALRPDDAGTVINDAIAFEQIGNKQLAEQQLKRAIALAPKETAPYVDLGSLYLQQSREDEAIQCFEKAIENNPNDPTSYFDLAVLFQQKGQDRVALSFYQKVLRLKPDDPDTLLYMSKLHLKPGGS